MKLVQVPESISLSGNLAEFVIEDCGSPVRFILECAGTQIVNEYLYPDENKNAIVDVSAVIEVMLQLSLPLFSDTEYIQTDAVKRFTAKVESSYIYDFTVVRGGVDNFRQTTIEFLKYNFLTWQPRIKEIYLRQPEFLSYFGTVDTTLNIKASFADKTTETHTIKTTLGKVVSYNMNYDIVNSYFTKQVSYYDVFVTNAAGERLTYIQRYLPVPEPERVEIYFFHNTLAGIDTLVCTGTLTQSYEAKSSLARINKETTDRNVDYSVSYEQNTGIIQSREQALWLHDFFISACRYHFTDVFRKIYIEESDNKYTEFEINNYVFEFCYSKQKIYNNVPRNNQALPTILEFPTPDNLFFLTPRLSEYPIAVYADDLMIPVQLPYDGAWKRIAASSFIANINIEIEKLKISLKLFKGYFLTEASLKTSTSPKIGDYAYVGNTYPGVVYNCSTAGLWFNTGRAPEVESISLVDYATLSHVAKQIALEATNRDEAIEVETINRQYDFESVKTAMNNAIAASDKALNMTNSFTDKLEYTLITQEDGFYITDVQGNIGAYINPEADKLGKNIDIEIYSDIEYNI